MLLQIQNGAVLLRVKKTVLGYTQPLFLGSETTEPTLDQVA